MYYASADEQDQIPYAFFMGIDTGLMEGSVWHRRYVTIKPDLRENDYETT